MNLHREIWVNWRPANEMNVVENCVYQNQIRDPNASLERVECQEKSEIKNLILRKWEIVRELPICERPPKSEILNSQFSSVFTKEDRENNPKMGSGPKPGLGPLIISEHGVLKQLSSLSPNKVYDPDQIPPWFLKDYAAEIAPTLTDIFQDSIDSGTVPRRWKGANVCAVFLKRERNLTQPTI